MGSTAPGRGRDAGADGRAGADAREGSTGSSRGAGGGEETFAGGEAGGSWSGAKALVAPPPPLDNRRRFPFVLLNTWTSLATDRSRRRVRRGTRTSSGIGSHSGAFWPIAARRARWRECASGRGVGRTMYDLFAEPPAECTLPIITAARASSTSSTAPAAPVRRTSSSLDATGHRTDAHVLPRTSSSGRRHASTRAPRPRPVSALHLFG